MELGHENIQERVRVAECLTNESGFNNVLNLISELKGFKIFRDDESE